MSSVYAIDKERLLFVAISGPFDNTRAIIGSYSLSVVAVPIPRFQYIVCDLKFIDKSRIRQITNCYVIRITIADCSIHLSTKYLHSPIFGSGTY